jgi:hypothetical protein
MDHHYPFSGANINSRRGVVSKYYSLSDEVCSQNAYSQNADDIYEPAVVGRDTSNYDLVSYDVLKDDLFDDKDDLGDIIDEVPLPNKLNHLVKHFKSQSSKKDISIEKEKDEKSIEKEKDEKSIEEEKEKPATENRWECEICALPNPSVVLVSCGHSICESCVPGIIKSSNQCPFCRTEISFHIPNITLNALFGLKSIPTPNTGMKAITDKTNILIERVTKFWIMATTKFVDEILKYLETVEDSKLSVGKILWDCSSDVIFRIIQETTSSKGEDIFAKITKLTLSASTFMKRINIKYNNHQCRNPSYTNTMSFNIYFLQDVEEYDAPVAIGPY